MYTNVSVKRALIDICHTFESLLGNHTIPFIVNKVKNDGYWKIRNFIEAMNKIKSDTKKRIENFQKFELPLLIRKGLLIYSDVTENSNSVTKYSNRLNGLHRFNYEKLIYQEILCIIFQDYNKNIVKYGPDVIRTREPRHVKAVS